MLWRACPGARGRRGEAERRGKAIKQAEDTFFRQQAWRGGSRRFGNKPIKSEKKMEKGMQARGATGSFRTSEKSLKKAAKRLMEALGEGEIAGRAAGSLKLSECQEALAKALGWPSFALALRDAADTGGQAWQGAAAPGTNPFFSKLSSLQEAFGAVSALLQDQEGMWQSRAKMLLRASMECAGIEKIRTCSAQEFRRLFTLESLLCWAKPLGEQADPEALRRRDCALDYLRSLPGYRAEAARQPDTVHEQHGYLEMQLAPAALALGALEARDPVLVPGAGPQRAGAGMRRSLGSDVLEALWCLAPQSAREGGLRLSGAALALSRALNPKTRSELAAQLYFCLERTDLLEELANSD